MPAAPAPATRAPKKQRTLPQVMGMGQMMNSMMMSGNPMMMGAMNPVAMAGGIVPMMVGGCMNGMMGGGMNVSIGRFWRWRRRWWCWCHPRCSSSGCPAYCGPCCPCSPWGTPAATCDSLHQVGWCCHHKVCKYDQRLVVRRVLFCPNWYDQRREAEIAKCFQERNAMFTPWTITWHVSFACQASPWAGFPLPLRSWCHPWMQATPLAFRRVVFFSCFGWWPSSNQALRFRIFVLCHWINQCLFCLLIYLAFVFTHRCLFLCSHCCVGLVYFCNNKHNYIIL